MEYTGKKKYHRRRQFFRAWTIVLSTLLLIGNSILYGYTAVQAEEIPEELSNLHAQSAVLMDADSGRVLFEKNGYERRAMASTTKIMTCILALERGDLKSMVTISKQAASQPKVHLGMTEGQQFFLEDLLYSLMLESHNDSAYAIAEHIGGTVEEFAGMMNQKAQEIGCRNTYFISPNGLDAEDEKGKHSTTAEELALIMRYCLKQSRETEAFLTITRTASRSFTDVEGKRSYSCQNHNAFLNMMEGALTGKTGFTTDAGYCYIGALSQEGKTFIVALLGCGWPSHKGYKWEDTRALMRYGLSHYRYREVYRQYTFRPVTVKGGHIPGQDSFEETKLPVQVDTGGKEASLKLLLRDDETVDVSYSIDELLSAPVEKGSQVGVITYSLKGLTLREDTVIVTENAVQNTYLWTVSRLFSRYCMR